MFEIGYPGCSQVIPGLHNCICVEASFGLTTHVLDKYMQMPSEQNDGISRPAETQSQMLLGSMLKSNELTKIGVSEFGHGGNEGKRKLICTFVSIFGHWKTCLHAFTKHLEQRGKSTKWNHSARRVRSDFLVNFKKVKNRGGLFVNQGRRVRTKKLTFLDRPRGGVLFGANLGRS